MAFLQTASARADEGGPREAPQARLLQGIPAHCGTPGLAQCHPPRRQRECPTRIDTAVPTPSTSRQEVFETRIRTAAFGGTPRLAASGGEETEK